MKWVVQRLFFFLGDCADIHWHRWCGPVYLWWGKGLQLVAMSVRNSWESTCCPTPRDESVRVRMAESQELVAPKDPIVCAKERWIFSRGKHYLRWLVIQPRMNQVATRIVMLLILVSVTKTSQSTLCAWQSNAQQHHILCSGSTERLMRPFQCNVYICHRSILYVSSTGNSMEFHCFFFLKC